jgi:hypothetical protein
MEVDRVESRGKGKNKGKNKGRGSGAEWAGMLYGRGRGRGRSNKGKSKGKAKGKSKGKQGSNKGGAKGGKKSSGRGKVAYEQCSNCMEYGHWSRECPNMAVNQVSNKQEVIPPDQATSFTTPMAKANTSTVVRKIFQFGTPAPSCPSSPTSPTSPALSQGRMVLFHDAESEWMQFSGLDEDQEWVIQDSGSDVSLLPAKYHADADSSVTLGALQNCQGGSLQTAGTKKAELITTTSDGEEILLQHEFIVGNVTSCLVSLGQLFQGGWSIQKDDDGSLQLQSPGNEVRISVEYKNRSFAIKAHVRQVADTGQCMALERNDEYVVRTVVYAEDEIEDSPLDEWQMTADGTPFLKKLTTNFVNPEPQWPFWPYRTTLIRKHQKDKAWTVVVVELSRKIKGRREPFGMIFNFFLQLVLRMNVSH